MNKSIFSGSLLERAPFTKNPVNHFGTLTETEVEDEVAVQDKVQKPKNIILYNDHVNTFEFVIETLVEICGHNPLQAEQCAFLVHYSGKCAVKTGSYSKLEPLCSALLNKGLTAEIE